MKSLGGQPIAVTAVDLVSPAGFDVDQTCAALRAGITRFRKHPYFFPRLPEPPLGDPDRATVAMVIAPNSDLMLPGRLLTLATRPMNRFIANARLRRADFKTLGFLLSLPAVDRSARRPGYEEDFLRIYATRLGIDLGPQRFLVQEGHTGVLTAIGEAARWLSTGTCRFCVVLGVDSYLDDDSLKTLDDVYRLKSQRNVDGFVPGEAAVLLLLEKVESAKQRGARILARIEGLGIGTEKDTISSDKRSSAAGLAEAIRGAREDAGATEPHRWVISDLNGESYRATEWGTLRARMGAEFQTLGRLWHHADCIGDTGGASAGLQIARACRAFARGYQPADAALVLNGSDGGQRAACLIKRPA